MVNYDLVEIKGEFALVPGWLFQLRCHSCRAIVLMARPKETSGEFFLSDGAIELGYGDVGTVIHSTIEGLHPMKRVVLNPEAGTWHAGFTVKEDSTDDQIRFLGIATDRYGSPSLLADYRLIMGTVDDDMGAFVPQKPLIVVEREIVEQTKGGILLPDSVAYRPCVGRVSHVYDGCDLAVGAKVVYNPCGYKHQGLKYVQGGEFTEAHVIMHELSVEAIVKEHTICE
jgi:co-chaperonin GroES (HSP10)